MKTEINTKSSLLMNKPLYQSNLVNKSLINKSSLTSNLTSLKHSTNSDLNLQGSIKKAKITEIHSSNKPNLASLISGLTNTTLTSSISTKSNLLLGSSLLASNNLHCSYKSHTKPSLLSTKQYTTTQKSSSFLNSVSTQNSSLVPKEVNKRKLLEDTIATTIVSATDFYDNNWIGQEEFLQVDSLINFIDNEQRERKEFLSAKRFKQSSSPIFLDNSLITDRNTITREQRLKDVLLNLVSSSLLNQPNFKNIKDQTRLTILQIAEQVVANDPEFILKLALYTRRELNIRVTANFLISLAAFSVECRPFLSRYFKASIMLPSDWIEVAEQYQLFTDKKLNFGSLPSALRKCMCDKFPDFDAYQLAKYNKEKSRSAKNKSLTDVKHVKTNLKDSEGNETAPGEAIVEDKYIKTLKKGLDKNDRILFELVILEDCDVVKFDIIYREIKKEIKKEVKRGRRGTLPDPKEKQDLDETVALRVSLDIKYKRIIQKSFVKKCWTKRPAVNNAPEGFELNKKMNSNFFFIDVDSRNFRFGILNEGKQENLSSYSHNEHKVSLDDINHIRVSGCGIKLKNLTVKSKENVNLDSQMSEVETDVEIRQRAFTLKQLIRQLHISNPVDNVMSLIGKKYPSSFEEFMQAKLPGIYDSEKAGKRMKLPIPETWETQISMNGNKAHVWEQLIDNKKLPYMAMLRNIRNMIKVGISEKHHQWVIKKLQDEGAVVNSKQFPFRFFTAYEVLDELERDYNEYFSTLADPSRSTMSKKDKEKLMKSDLNYDESLLKRYKTALDNALKVATTFNISPIKGNTAIFVNIGNKMRMDAGGSAAKRLGKSVTNLADIATLLALMFKYSCENSKLVAFTDSMTFKDIELEHGTILDNMKSVTQLNNIHDRMRAVNRKNVFAEILDTREHFDNLIILSNDSLIDSSYMKKFLTTYRTIINDKLLFVNVSLGASTCGLDSDPDFDHENDVTICGYSDAILRFVAEKGNQGQLTHIENIEKSYDLPELKTKTKSKSEKPPVQSSLQNSTSLIPAPSSKWKTLKVFISSTFRDMHSERDILTRTVFPLLRTKLADYLINVHEIDMRWGITEAEANDNKALEICLNQVLDCDIFIGILGERYGHVTNKYPVLPNPKLNWLKTYPAGASITELEIECQLRKKRINNTFDDTFFYLRNNQSFIAYVPDEITSHFNSENDMVKEKISKLKARLTKLPYESQLYESKWFKVDENSEGDRALLTDLDTFAQRVFSNVFNCIIKNHYEAQTDEELCNEGVNLLRVNKAFVNASADLFSGRNKLVNSLDKLFRSEINFKETTNASTEASQALIKQQNSIVNILLVQGETGSGKSSFLSYFFSKYLINTKSDLLSRSFIYTVGSFNGSELIINFLKIFIINMVQSHQFYEINIDEVFASVDNEYLKLVFGQVLSEWSAKNESLKYHIVIDGVDMLCDTTGSLDESFDWLPQDLPPCFNLILSSRMKSKTRVNLGRMATSGHFENKIHVREFNIEPLDILDKSEIVRTLLGQFNKHLDESLLNNQMKLITGKSDSRNPLYLSLACEELRVHSHFESLNSKLKELPTKLNLLLQYVLERLEAEYGKSFTNALFMFLIFAKEGLKEQELYDLITLFFSIERLKMFNEINSSPNLIKSRQLFENQPNISTQKFLSFVQTIAETFLKPRSQDKILQLKNDDVLENALRLRFKTSRITTDVIHKIFSLYYWVQIDENFTGNWNMRNPRAYTALPYHLSFFANSLIDLETVLTSLVFLGNKSELGMSAQLMEDFDLHESSKVKARALKFFGIRKPIRKTKLSQKFQDYLEFITQSYHLLALNPKCIYQEAMNQPEGSNVSTDLRTLLNTNTELSTNLIELLNKSMHESASIKPPMRISDFTEGVYSVAISLSNDKVACGTENCEIKMFAISTAKLLKTYQGHSGKINQLCFVNNETLCSASSDGLASLWSVDGGFRIKVLNKHKHTVSDVCREPNGKSFVTVGWDCSAKIWNTTDGEFLGDLRGHPRAINCIVFDPTGDRVATGCWDSCIRIFNTVSRNRIAVLRGHNQSVRSISYSRDGVYIASACLGGSVMLWNSKTGIQVASLKGHSMPVNSLSFSPNNQFLVTGSTDRRCKVWSGSVGKMTHVIDNKESGSITSICYYQKTGEFIAAGFHSGEIKIFETQNGTLVSSTKAHEKIVTRLKFTTCGNYLVSASQDTKVKVFSGNSLTFTESSKLDLVAECDGNKKGVTALAINDHDLIITGSEDSSINVYGDLGLIKEDYNEQFTNEYLDNFGTRKKPIVVSTLKPTHTLTAHKSAVRSCAINSIDYKFASASIDALIIVWKISHQDFSCTELFRIDEAHMDWITDLKWSNTSDYFVTASNDFSLKIWNGESGKMTSHLVGHTSNINSCSFEYGCVVSSCFDGTVKVWSHKGNEITTLVGHQSRVNACELFVKVKYADLDQKVTEEGEDGMDTDFLWGDEVDKQNWTDQHNKKKIKKQNFEIQHVNLATGSDDSTIRLWKPIESDYLASLEKHNDKINSVAIAGNDYLATASNDSTVNVWNMNEFFNHVNSGQFVHRQMVEKTHICEITSIAESNDFVVTSSLDGVMIMWQCIYDENNRITNLQFIQEIQAHDTQINKICMFKSPLPKTFIATCANENKLKLWLLERSSSTIKHHSTLTTSSPVRFITCINREQKDYFLTVEADSNKILIRIYQIETDYRIKMHSKLGACVTNVNSIIFQVESNKTSLFITLVEDEVITFRMDDLFKDFKTYFAKQRVKNEMRTLKVKSGDQAWFTTACVVNENMFFGDSKGNVYSDKVGNENGLELLKTCHKKRITEIYDTEKNLLTSSEDGTVKIWTKNFEQQLGQFNSANGISAICKFDESSSGKDTFIIGDNMGLINLIRWHN